MYSNYITRSLRFVWDSSKKWTILLLICQFTQAILPLFTLYLTKLLIDSIALSKNNIEFKEVLVYVLLIGFIQFVQAMVGNYQMMISETQKQLVSDHMSSIIIDKALSLDLSYYENPEFHNTFHQAQRQALYRPTLILTKLTEFLKSSFLLVSIAGLLLFMHWSIAIILITFALPIAFVKWHYSKKLYSWEKKRTSLEREASYINKVLTADTYVKEVRIFNIGESLKERFIKIRKQLFTEKFKIFNARARSSIYAKSVEIIASVLTYSFIVFNAVDGSITVGDLVMYFQAFQKGQVAIQSSLNSLVGINDNRLFLNYIFNFLALEPKIKAPEIPINLTLPIESVEFDNISFKYPDNKSDTISDLSLKFNKGQVIAIVGENGSGKTTLIKLLSRLYDPYSGTIKYNGIDIKNIDPIQVRKSISVIYQDFAKYQLTTKENIEIADIKNKGSEDKLITSAKKSTALEFINSLEHKFEQQLGKRFTNGHELSTGQWQKIALTRAFYKDAEIIILDEPSSSIDPLSEAKIFEELKSIAKNKILILISHRIYNLSLADQIIVLDKGIVKEKGSHEELLSKGGIYKEMFSKQSINNI